MKNRRADEEKMTESGDEQQHRPEREGARQDEAENGEGGDRKRRRRRREEAVRGRRGTMIAVAEEKAIGRGK